jgi:hypothetical protein
MFIGVLNEYTPINRSTWISLNKQTLNLKPEIIRMVDAINSKNYTSMYTCPKL